MAFVGAEALAVGAVPRAGDVVFGDGEDQVAFFRESTGMLASSLHDLDGCTTNLTCVSARSWPESNIGLMLGVL